MLVGLDAARRAPASSRDRPRVRGVLATPARGRRRADRRAQGLQGRWPATLRFDDGAPRARGRRRGAGVEPASAHRLRPAGDDDLAPCPRTPRSRSASAFGDGWFGDVIDQLADARWRLECRRPAGRVRGDRPRPARRRRDAGRRLARPWRSAPTSTRSSFFDSGGWQRHPGRRSRSSGDPDGDRGRAGQARGRRPATRPCFLDSDSDGDMVAVGPNADYRESLLEDGGLGDSEVFKDVVPRGRRRGGDPVREPRRRRGLAREQRRARQGVPEVADNLEPLRARRQLLASTATPATWCCGSRPTDRGPQFGDQRVRATSVAGNDGMTFIARSSARSRSVTISQPLTGVLGLEQRLSLVHRQRSDRRERPREVRRVAGEVAVVRVDPDARPARPGRR